MPLHKLLQVFMDNSPSEQTHLSRTTPSAEHLKSLLAERKLFYSRDRQLKDAAIKHERLYRYLVRG